MVRRCLTRNVCHRLSHRKLPQARPNDRLPLILCSENWNSVVKEHDQLSTLLFSTHKFKFCAQKPQQLCKQTTPESCTQKIKLHVQKMEILYPKMEILCSENGKFSPYHGMLAFPWCDMPLHPVMLTLSFVQLCMVVEFLDHLNKWLYLSSRIYPVEFLDHLTKWLYLSSSFRWQSANKNKCYNEKQLVRSKKCLCNSSR